MDNLKTAITKIAKGVSAAVPVSDRAVAIREMIARGGVLEAEGVAKEIELIQRAEMDALTGIARPIGVDPAKDTWKLTAERWAEYVIHAHRMGRSITVPSGSSRDVALAEFRRVTHDRGMTCKVIHKTDIFCATLDRGGK